MTGDERWPAAIFIISLVNNYAESVYLFSSYQCVDQNK
ncbi:protein of unknown function [Serratia sp. Tan611]|nr:protein of unknown function [Serratia sp. Tan611]